MNNNTDEYLRRNILVAKAEGAKAALEAARAQMLKLRKRPVGLLSRVSGALLRIGPCIHELAMHRDELLPLAGAAIIRRNAVLGKRRRPRA